MLILLKRCFKHPVIYSSCKFIQTQATGQEFLQLSSHEDLKTRLIYCGKRFLQTKPAGQAKEALPAYFQLSDVFKNENESAACDLVHNMIVYEDFLSEADEQSILNEIEPYLKTMRYEFDHWDDAIHGYRETERLKWNPENTQILDRVRKLVFPPNIEPLKYVHILDLDKKGYIKPHIDAIRFCGDTIAGLSLLSDSVMRLVHDKRKELFADIFLKRRSLYIMKNTARFDYTHEILSNEYSVFNGQSVIKDRRISIICRNEPKPEDKL